MLVVYIFISKNTKACFTVKALQVFLQQKMNLKQTKKAVLFESRYKNKFPLVLVRKFQGFKIKMM